MVRDPYDEIRRLEERMNRLFESFWGRPLGLLPGERSLPAEREKGGLEPYREPYLDIIETDKELIATAEMPGLNKQDIKVNVTEDRLEIAAETKQEKKEEKEGYIYRERSSGRYYRSVSLPTTVDADRAVASYKNGVLEIRMPKTEVKKKTSIKID